MAFVDGKLITQFKDDMFTGTTRNALDFSKVMSAGMHILEVYGAEGCCDGTLKWTFSVNGDQDLDFTAKNLNNFKGTADQTQKICAMLKGYDTICQHNSSSYHYTINTTHINNTDVNKVTNNAQCSVLVTTQDKTCAQYCASNNLTCYYAQDNIGKGCALNSDHNRQNTTANGCNQKWNN
jgi:hypothetical protein